MGPKRNRVKGKRAALLHASGSRMQEMSMQMLTIAIGINSVSRIDEAYSQFRGSSARYQLVRELHSGTQNSKTHKTALTGNRSRKQGSNPLGHVVARSHDRAALEGAVCVKITGLKDAPQAPHRPLAVHRRLRIPQRCRGARQRLKECFHAPACQSSASRRRKELSAPGRDLQTTTSSSGKGVTRIQ
jgi:hypothetical protein